MKPKTIQEAEEAIKTLQAYIDEQGEEQTKKTGRFVPKMGEEYWYVNWYVDWDVDSALWDGDEFDDYYLLTGSCFRTKEEAEAYKEYQEALGRVRIYILDNFPFEPDWKNNKEERWYFHYDHKLKQINYNYSCGNHQFTDLLPYLPSEESCEQTIEDNTADLKLIFKYNEKNK